MQIPIFKPQTEWLPPEEFPDLSNKELILSIIIGSPFIALWVLTWIN